MTGIVFLIAYAAISLITLFGLCVEVEYRRLRTGGYVDASHVMLAAVLWPVVAMCFVIVWTWERVWPRVGPLLPTPSRVALWLHGRSRVRRFVETTRTEGPTDYRETGRVEK